MNYKTWSLLFLCLICAPLLRARDFQICSNYASQNLYVAYGYQYQGARLAKGWFMVRPGRCIPFEAPIKGGKFYYFAYNADKTQRYDGEHPFCVDSKPFATRLADPQSPDCEARGLLLRKFKAFELEQAKETRLFLEPPSGAEVGAVPYSEADQAQLIRWADQGDANARAELQRRGDSSPAPVQNAGPRKSVDLKEGPQAPQPDRDAFRVE